MEPIHQSEEAELIRKARQRDDDAYAQLVTYFTPRLYRVVRRMADDSGEAEAIVQETFLRAWENLARYQEDRPFFPYLVTIAINLGRDQWRKSRFVDFSGLDSIEDELPDSDTVLETQVEQAELLKELAQAVSELPPAYRAVIAMRYDAGMSYQEIAQGLQLPVNTVRTHLRRAKIQLRQALERQE